MSGSERRGSPRKECVVPLSFRVLAPSSQLDDPRADYEAWASKGSIHSTNMQGEALNLSERGMYFTAREKLNVGERLEV